MIFEQLASLQDFPNLLQRGIRPAAGGSPHPKEVVLQVQSKDASSIVNVTNVRISKLLQGCVSKNRGLWDVNLQSCHYQWFKNSRSPKNWDNPLAHCVLGTWWDRESHQSWWPCRVVGVAGNPGLIIVGGIHSTSFNCLVNNLPLSLLEVHMWYTSYVLPVHWASVNLKKLTSKYSHHQTSG